jgi:hypothetical protein
MDEAEARITRDENHTKCREERCACCSVHKPKFDSTAFAQAPLTARTCKALDDDFNIVAKQSEKTA